MNAVAGNESGRGERCSESVVEQGDGDGDGQRSVSAVVVSNRQCPMGKLNSNKDRETKVDIPRPNTWDLRGRACIS